MLYKSLLYSAYGIDYAYSMTITVVFWLALFTIVATYMSLWYCLALYSRRYDVVDSAWGLGFILIAWVSLALRGNFAAVQVMSAMLVSLWGLRLSLHIGSRNWRKSTDDHRYQAMRDRWGKRANQLAFFHIFLLQGALMLLVSTPMIAIAFTRQTANIISYIGWAVWLFGIVYEAVADRQLATFITHREKGSHTIMDKGLWKLSRHPNYFGEVTAWIGAAIVAVSLSAWWGIVGAIVITFLITKISGIPPLERHYNGNEEYEAYRKRTPVLIPRLLPRTPVSRS